ncbi:MAG: YHS domain-containing (seleno)protein [Burkholderiales bacterium]
MRRTILILVSSFFALLMQGTVLSQEPGAPRLVLKGHDPVAYFTDSKPVKGDPKVRYDWDDGRYYFASARNRDLFSANPERYAPQFAGYCTGSMSRGVRNEGNPEAWVIVDGRLYVFGAPDSATAMQTREKAQKDPEYLAVRIPRAEKNWRERK